MSKSDKRFIFSKKCLVAHKYPVQLSGIGEELLQMDFEKQSEELVNGLVYLDDIRRHRKNAKSKAEIEETLETYYEVLHSHFISFFAKYPARFEDKQKRGRCMARKDDEKKQNKAHLSNENRRKAGRRGGGMDIDEDEFDQLEGGRDGSEGGRRCEGMDVDEDEREDDEFEGT